jgi:hypothetical protein
MQQRIADGAVCGALSASLTRVKRLTAIDFTPFLTHL